MQKSSDGVVRVFQLKLMSCLQAQGKSDATSITFDGDAAANGASNGSCTVTANGTVTHVRQ